jgi:hypothetical protein
MTRNKLQVSSHLTQRLGALKEAERRLQRLLQQAVRDPSMRERQLSRLRDYQNEIRRTRHNRDEEDHV